MGQQSQQAGELLHLAREENQLRFGWGGFFADLYDGFSHRHFPLERLHDVHRVQWLHGVRFDECWKRKLT